MFTYYPTNVCSKQIDIEVENDTVKSVIFHGGCPGNLLGISKIIKGMKIQEVIEAFDNNRCGHRDTSCPDQLAKALQSYLKNER